MRQRSSVILLGLMCFGALTLPAQESDDISALPLSALERQANAGQSTAMSELCLRYDEGRDGVAQDPSLATAWCRKGAERGDERAELKLAGFYAQGRGVPQDLTQAANWYKKLAEQGSAAGEFKLGEAYNYGLGVPQDYEAAILYYQKSLDGHLTNARGPSYLPYAEFKLGVSFEKGIGKPRNYTKAIELYQKSAKLGSSDAMTSLGAMYEDGRGVPSNDATARQWLNQASAQGNQRAVASLKQLDADAAARSAYKETPQDISRAYARNDENAEAKAKAEAKETASSTVSTASTNESTPNSVSDIINAGLNNLNDTLAQGNARQAAQNDQRMQQVQRQVADNDARRAQQVAPSTTTASSGTSPGCNDSNQACKATGNPPPSTSSNRTIVAQNYTPPPPQPVAAAPLVPIQSDPTCVAEGSSIAPGTTARCSPSVCREMNLMVQMDASWADTKHTNHEVVGWFSNSDGVTDATCVWAFHRAGQWGDGGEMIVPAGAQHRGGEGGGIWTMGADSSDIKYDCFEGRSPVDVHGNSCTAAVKFTGSPAAGTME